MQAKPPRNEHELELALVRRAGNRNKQATDDRTTMANAIVAQMLGEGVAVKGGSMLRFRYGSKNSRYTMDFDATRKIDLDSFIKGFRERLSAGWNGFTGEADILPQASPVGVPFDYVMQPWPPTIVPLPNWDTLYKEQIADLPVAKDVATAIKWANSLVSTIVNLS